MSEIRVFFNSYLLSILNPLNFKGIIDVLKENGFEKLLKNLLPLIDIG